MKKITYKVVFNSDIKDTLNGKIKTYKKGKVFKTGMPKEKLDDFLKQESVNSTWVSFNTFTRFNPKKDFDIIEITTTTKERKVKI